MWDCGTPSDVDGGGGGGATSGSGAAAAAGEADAPPNYLTMRMHTKYTPVVAARYTRTNVLLAVGAFQPELMPAHRRPAEPAPKEQN